MVFTYHNLKEDLLSKVSWSIQWSGTILQYYPSVFVWPSPLLMCATYTGFDWLYSWFNDGCMATAGEVYSPWSPIHGFHLGIHIILDVLYINRKCYNNVWERWIINSKTNWPLSTKLYGKFEDLDFCFVNFPYIYRNIPENQTYGVSIYQDMPELVLCMVIL